MIRLGTHDIDVSDDAKRTYARLVREATRVDLSEVQSDEDRLSFHARPDGGRQTMSVSQVQKALVDLGFFPGGAVDGLCGYRTYSAIRLFQEYVRSVEDRGGIGIPDGIFGPATEGHLQRWMDQGLTPDWAPTMERWASAIAGNGELDGTEFDRWLELGRKVQTRYASRPSRALQMVQDFGAPTDTHGVGEWDFSPDLIHLFGIRRDQFGGKFDDVFILLLKGLVFKFQGSTEPGSSRHPDGRPFLVHGQHDYHFGWHQLRYLALRPQGRGGGVLVVRSKNDDVLDEADLDKGLSPNASINIHWAGKGLTRNVNKWSEGCQVVTGSLYVNHNGELVDCSAFVAMNKKEVSSVKTRGAYNVMVDLATALSGDMSDATVRYTLLEEGDLDLEPDLRDDLVQVRAAALAEMK